MTHWPMARRPMAYSPSAYGLGPIGHRTCLINTWIVLIKLWTCFIKLWIVLVNLLSLIWFISLQYFRFKDTGRACSGDYITGTFGNPFKK